LHIFVVSSPYSSTSISRRRLDLLLNATWYETLKACREKKSYSVKPPAFFHKKVNDYKQPKTTRQEIFLRRVLKKKRRNVRNSAQNHHF